MIFNLIFKCIYDIIAIGGEKNTMKRKYFSCCVDCEKRHPACHSTCEQYIKDKKEHDEEVHQINLQKERLSDAYFGRRENKYKKKKKYRW